MLSGFPFRRTHDLQLSADSRVTGEVFQSDELVWGIAESTEPRSRRRCGSPVTAPAQPGRELALGREVA